MIKLKSYIESNHTSQASFANAYGFSRSAVHAMLKANKYYVVSYPDNGKVSQMVVMGVKEMINIS